jgi:hypothetical protein
VLIDLEGRNAWGILLGGKDALRLELGALWLVCCLASVIEARALSLSGYPMLAGMQQKKFVSRACHEEQLAK